MLPAGVAVLGIERLETGATVGPTFLHDVALAAQHRLTLKAAEVLHVPVAALGFGALVRQDDLRMEAERQRRIHRRGKKNTRYSLLNDRLPQVDSIPGSSSCVMCLKQTSENM